jgi:DNA-binding NarL/FixJ family response regulator
MGTPDKRAGELQSPDAASLGMRAADWRLTIREAEVVGLVADGLGNKEIARRLGITEATVKAHLGVAFSKLGARNRTQVALAVYERRRQQANAGQRW